MRVERPAANTMQAMSAGPAMLPSVQGEPELSGEALHAPPLTRHQEWGTGDDRATRSPLAAKQPRRRRVLTGRTQDPSFRSAVRRNAAMHNLSWCVAAYT